MTPWSRSLLAAAAATSLAGCGPPAPPPPLTDPPPVSAHAHPPPHGGTAVRLGAEAYHVELVREAEKGRMQAYILASDCETPVAIDQASFEIVAVAKGVTHPLVFTAVADPAHGESASHSAHFTATGEWLSDADQFACVLTHVEIEGIPFSQVLFHFPEGNDTL